MLPGTRALTVGTLQGQGDDDRGEAAVLRVVLRTVAAGVAFPCIRTVTIRVRHGGGEAQAVAVAEAAAAAAMVGEGVITLTDRRGNAV